MRTRVRARDAFARLREIRLGVSRWWEVTWESADLDQDYHDAAPTDMTRADSFSRGTALIWKYISTLLATQCSLRNATNAKYKVVLFLSRDSARSSTLDRHRRVNTSALATPCHPRLHGIARNLLYPVSTFHWRHPAAHFFPWGQSRGRDASLLVLLFVRPRRY